MKKLICITLIPAILALTSACSIGRNNEPPEAAQTPPPIVSEQGADTTASYPTAETETIPEPPNEASSEADEPSVTNDVTLEAAEPPVMDDDSPALATLHPFAGALSEFFVGLAPVPEWALPAPYNTVTMPFVTHAMLVDVDGSGTLGMLASKWTLEVQRYLPHSSAQSLLVHRLFLLDNGQILTFALENIAVTPSGRLVTMGGVDGQGISMSAHTLLEFNNGQLAPVKSIMRTAYGHWEYHLVEVWVASGEDDTYAINYHTTEFWRRDAEQDQPITNAEFHELMTRYGLNNANPFFWEFPDETNAILAMSAN